MKKVISLILSVTMLASAAQLYASADISIFSAQTEQAEDTTQAITQTAQSAETETQKNSDEQKQTESSTASSVNKTSDVSQPAGVSKANAQLLNADGDNATVADTSLMGARDGDVQTVTSDYIKFSLFNYDTDINYINTIKDSTATGKYNMLQPTDYTRSLTRFYAFHGSYDSQYRPPNGIPTDDNPYWGTVDAYDERNFNLNHATVERTLDNGYPVINVTRNANGEDKKTHDYLKPDSITYNDRKIDYLFGGKPDDKSVTSYTANNTPLYMKKGHYRYSASEHAADYDTENNLFRVRNYTEATDSTVNDIGSTPDFDGNSYSDFLPFNYTNGASAGTAANGRTYNVTSSEVKNKQRADYWFGMRMDMEFVQGKDGKIINSATGKEEKMILKFSGDDDIWMFVDDVLVMDIGGSHNSSTGIVNFAEGTIEQFFYYKKDGRYDGSNRHYTTTLNDCFTSAGITPNGGWNSTKTAFADYSTHKLSLFYIERGAGSAACSLDFNLQTPNSMGELYGDIKTVTSDAIKFSLFDYDEDINYINEVKTSTDSDSVKYNESKPTRYLRELSEYFAFHGSVPNGYHKYRDGSGKVEEYDARSFSSNHATVERTLYDNYPVINLTRNAFGIDTKSDPGLDLSKRQIDYLFGGGSDRSVTSYSPKNTPLYETANGHYRYSASEHAADYDTVNNLFRVRDYTEVTSYTAEHAVKNYDNNDYTPIVDADNKFYSDFMPFNYTNGETIGNTEKSHRAYNLEAMGESDTNYWFGMRMDVDFIQGAYGKSNDEEMIFSFTGDDDIWVFIDDVLVLDIGGSHHPSTGTINFATGEIEQYFNFDSDGRTDGTKRYYTTSLKKCYDKAGKTPNGGWNSAETTYANYTSHKLSFFYLERGGGTAICNLDFNLPTRPENSLEVSKDVVDSNNKNINATDSTVYTFKITHNDVNSTALSGEEANYTIGSEKKSVADSKGQFTLQGGQTAYFTNLASNTNYKIEEITEDLTYGNYLKSTSVAVDDGSSQNSNFVTVTPTNVTQTVKFTNILKSFDVTFKYYGRETVNGKPADIKKEPTTYTKTFLANDKNSEKYFNGTYQDSIYVMMLDASTNLKCDNVLDTYSLWITQWNASGSGADGNTGIKYFATTADSVNNPYYKIVSENYADPNNYKYRADCYGKPVNGEKWVTYYNSSGAEVNYESVPYENKKSVDVSRVTVWLFNTPTQYTVNAYQAKTFLDLKQISDGKYIADDTKEDNHKTIKAYYNQRLGEAIDDKADYSQATAHLAAYGLKSYVGKKLGTAASIANGDTTLKFAYWAFDSEGKNIASTDILYNYRITKDRKLYAVYTSDGTVNSGTPGLTATMNNPDVYFNSDGESITRLNTVMNPYNCPNNDTNIKNIAISYIIPEGNTKIVEAIPKNPVEGVNYVLLSELREAIEKTLVYVDENPGESSFVVRDFGSSVEGNQTLTAIKKGNYFVFFVDGHDLSEDDLLSGKDVSLTNKNRVEFVTNFKTSALSDREMFAFVSMYYDKTDDNENNGEWIVSDNYIDYKFNTNGKFVEEV